MKKLMIILASISVLIIIASQKSTAEAAVAMYESYCKDPVISPKNQYNPRYWDYMVTKDGPNFVLDYFQDPDENGVSLTITVEAMPLIATYSKWEDVCTPYESAQTGMTACKYKGKYGPGFHYAYWTRACVQQPPEETYRSIETSSISIWLEPTSSTIDLLGWKPYFQDTKKPTLRYLYPDQWALVVVRPGERKLIEKPWFHNSEDVEKFLKENKDFVILDTSSNVDLSASRLPFIWSSAPKNWALWLFGTYSECRADLSDLRGREVCSHYAVEKILGYGTNQLTVVMDRIPLDVPGEWYVGVRLTLSPAKFDSGKGVEPANEDNIFVFSDENDEKRFSFESYIIRSSPCNPDEPGNCWKEEKPSE